MRKLPANSHSSGPTATAPVVDSTAQALLMPSRQSNFGPGRAVRAQLVGHQHFGCEALLLKQLAHQFHGCGLVAPSLHQEVENLAFGVDGPPKVDHSAVDFQIDLVEMPSRMGLQATLS